MYSRLENLYGLYYIFFSNSKTLAVFLLRCTWINITFRNV